MRDEMLIEKQMDAYDRKMDREQYEEDIFCQCDICSSDIVTDEEYYDFDGEVICNNCIFDYVEEFKKFAD